MRLRFLIMPLAALFVLAACQDEPPVADQPESSTDPEMSTEPVIEQEETMPPAQPPAETSLERAVEMAHQDLAERTGVDTESIRVVEARRVTWRDGGLGCPEEGMMYTQALVEGMYILLESDGEQYAYHAGRDGVPFACPAERSQSPLERDSGAARE